jgi:hypothetical protein
LFFLFSCFFRPHSSFIFFFFFSSSTPPTPFPPLLCFFCHPPFRFYNFPFVPNPLFCFVFLIF